MQRDTLANYPYVTVRLACSRCKRAGAYELARHVAKYGSEIALDDLMAYLAGDCVDWRRRHPYKPRCGAFFADLGPRMPPPDESGAAGRVRLRVVR